MSVGAINIVGDEAFQQSFDRRLNALERETEILLRESEKTEQRACAFEHSKDQIIGRIVETTQHGYQAVEGRVKGVCIGLLYGLPDESPKKQD